MTVEVAVLNKQAVALAADSAVTIGGRENPKIFNTLKLFTLSKSQPVGIMVYSSAEVMDVPIETVIKVFRKELGNQKFATLDGYYDRFQDFLKQNVKLFPEEARISQCFQIINQNLADLRSIIQYEIGNRYRGWGRPNQTEAKTTARELLVAHCAEYRTAGNISGVTSTTRTRLKRKLRPHIEAWQDWFQDFYALSNNDVKLLSELCVDLILKDSASGCETGFVIAGFGQDDYFPRLRSFEFEASVMNVNKIREIDSLDMKTDKPGIVAFAQKEMVGTFVRGRSARLDDELLAFIDQFFEEQKQITAQDPSLSSRIASIHTFLDGMNSNLRQEFAQQLDAFTNRYHINPIEITVGAMPKEELAKMAEALVNLTSIKRRSTPDAETVGGPTDVAVISKGDGMVWIQRKHYFDNTLNPGFVNNYFNGG